MSVERGSCLKVYNNFFYSLTQRNGLRAFGVRI